jgi:hypothetical protein
MMDRYVTVGIGVLAGVVLFEAALIPGIVIGGSAVLAARYVPGSAGVCCAMPTDSPKRGAGLVRTL